MKIRKNSTGIGKLKKETYSDQKPDKRFKQEFIKYFCYFFVCILPVFTAYYYYNTSLNTNKFLSFPLDDPWIHLTFAKNIVEYFSFSYFKNEIVTAGSTSPLYVFITAVGFLISNNEMILSYCLGAAFFALSSFYFYKIALKEFNFDILLSLLISFIFIFDYWMNFIAVSGMETTLFISFLLMGVYFYKSKKLVPLGIVLGLLIWTRPDGIAFIAALILDYIYTRWFIKDKNNLNIFSTKEFLLVSGIFLIFLLSYIGMNLYLSGTILSNTYSAKVAFNIDSNSRIRFLSDYIWKFFTAEHYIYFLPGFIIVIATFFYNIIRRKYNQNSIFIFFIFLFILIYFIKLPMFSRFGRYFMPMIPFYILVSMFGYYSIFNFFKNYVKIPFIIKASNITAYLAILIFTFFSFLSYSKYYASQCKFIYERHVKTAYWLRDNTKENDVIGTHDIGAIGFYSRRKIIDIVGLINPDLAKHSNEENYNEKVMDYFRQSGVTYTAFFREWLLILNQNILYFSPDENSAEAFYVYNFFPDKTKILPRKMVYLLVEATKNMIDNDRIKIIPALDEILKIEPHFAMAYFYKAVTYINQNDKKNFEKNIKNALYYYPEYRDALLFYGGYLMKNNNNEEAKVMFSKVLEFDPSNNMAKKCLFILNDTLNNMKVK